MSIDKKRTLPLYLRIREDIRGKIESGTFPTGYALPFEHDLCIQYGVSRITVKHALRDLVNDGLIVRIKRKGTFVLPRGDKRSRSRRRTGMLALIVPDIEDLFISEIYRGVTSAASEQGYKISIHSSDGDIEKEAANIRSLRDRYWDGAVIFPNWGRANAEQVSELNGCNYPFVLVNRFFRDIQTDYVVTDNRTGACDAVEHLIGLGHHRIACIGWVECTAIEDRLAGYRQALERHGIEYDEALVRSVLDEDRDKYMGIEPRTGGCNEMKKLLQLEHPPTAVFAVSDRLAVGAMSAISQAGLTVPNDIALVGFDDVKYAADMDLTTVAQPAFETGQVAGRLLIKKLQKRGVAARKCQQIVLPAKLVIRGTCGARGQMTNRVSA